MGWIIKKKTEEVPEELPELPETFEEVKKKPFIKPQAKKPIERYKVVHELPTQQVMKYKDDEGNIINFITIEEALTELLNKLE